MSKAARAEETVEGAHLHRLTREHRDLLRCAVRLASRGGAPAHWLARETGFPEPKVYLLANDLMDAGCLQRPTGGPFLLTPQGQALLEGEVSPADLPQ